MQGSIVFSEAVGLSKILLFIEIVAALKKGEEKILATPLGGTVKWPVKFYAFELYELETTSGTPLSFSI